MSHGDDFIISLGLDIDDSEFIKIGNKIETFESKLNPIKIEIDIPKEKFNKKLEGIRKQLKNLGNTKVDFSGIGDGINLDLKNVNLDTSKLTVDTTKIEKSFESLANTINEIKLALGSVDDESGMKDLLTTINQVSRSLENVVKQFEELGRKDFSVNFDIKMGGSKNSPVSNNANFGNFVKKTALPQLEKRAKEYAKITEYYLGEHGNNDIDTIFSLIKYAENKQKIPIGSSSYALGASNDISNFGGTLSSKLEGYQGFFAEFEKAADALNIDLSSVNSKFSQSAEELVEKAFDIKKGVGEANDEVEKLKGLFGGNNNFNFEEANFDNINTQLNTLSETLKEINTFIKSFDLDKLDFSKLNFTTLEEQLKGVVESLNKVELSINDLSNASGVTNLITSFDKLSDTLQQVFSNLNLIQTYVNNAYKQSVGNVNSSVNNIGVNLDHDYPDQRIKMEESLKDYGFDDNSINLMMEDLDKLKIKVKDVKTEMTKNNKGNDVLRITIDGVEELENGVSRAVKVIRETKKIDGVWQTSKPAKVSISQSFNQEIKQTQEVTDAYKRLLEITKQIGKSNVDFIGLDKEESIKQFQVLERQIIELDEEYTELINKFGGSFKSSQLTNLDNEFKKIANSAEVAEAKVEDLKTELVKYIKTNSIAYNSDDNSSDFVKQYKNAEVKLSKLSHVSQSLENNMYSLSKALSDLISTDDFNDVDKLVAKYKEFQQLLLKVNNQIDNAQNDEKFATNYWKIDADRKSFILSIDKWKKRNSAALKDFGRDIENIRVQVEKADKAKLAKLKKEFDEVKDKAVLAGKATMSFSDRFKNQFSRLTTYYSASMFISEAMIGLRAMYENVLLVDTAMTELYRVTDLTKEQYNNLYDDMTKSAKEYGVALNDIITSTADWVKLGFNESTSVRLAEITTMYQHISDLENDVAVENLVTAYKGFQNELLSLYSGDEAKAIEYIADVYNELGNNYAVTADGVGDAMTRAASALDLAGNTFQESSAMITGISEVTQDYEKSGSALKILSLRLRGMKGQLEELGEETDENVENISKMQGQILNLTHGKVNIFDSNGEFKSTYEIMQGIAEVFDTLSSTEQAELLETIAGKHRANDVMALISNWEQVEKAVISANKAEGSASKENEKYLESLQGKIDTLKASWQALSNTVLNSEWLKLGIELLTGFINFIDELIKKIDILTPLLAFITGKSAVSIFKAFKGISVVKDVERDIFSLTSVLNKLGNAFPAIKEGIGVFTKALSSGTKGAGLFKAALSGLFTVAKAHPFIFAATAGLALITVLDKIIVTAEEANQAMTDAFDEYEEAKSKVEELNKELATTKERIDALENKKGLTFVEKEELEKLRETTRLLQIQAEIEERNAQREAVEAANAAEEAYNKNFTYEISENATESERNFAENGGYIQGLKVDESDVSSLIVYREEMEKLRDACDTTTEQGAKNWKNFQDEIDNTDKIIDEQLVKLVDYQLKFNAVPEDLLNESQKQISQQIDNQIDYIQKTKDPAKWKQDKFNSIFDDKTLAEEKKKYVEYAKAHKETGLIIGEVWGKLSPELETAIRQAGFTVQDFVDNINSEAGILKVNPEIEITPTKYSFADLVKDESFNKTVDSHIEKVNALKDALEKVKDGSFDVYGEDFVKLTREFPELADSADNLEEALKQSIEDINLGTFEQLMSYLEYMDSDADYSSLQNFIVALTDAEVEMKNVLDFSGFIDNLNNVVDSFDGLVSAMSKLRDGTALTKGELVDLISEYPQLLTEANLFTDGSIAGQNKMLDNLLKVYEAEYNATIDTKIAELKAANDILRLAEDNEKAKAKKLIEIAGYEVDGKVEEEADFVKALQDFNDLEGQNYVDYSNGVLNVNKESLEGMLTQEGDKVDLAEKIWDNQAVDIAESYADGSSDALKSINTFGSRLKTWASNIITKIFKPTEEAYDAAFDPNKTVEDGISDTSIDTEIKAGLYIDEDSKEVTINGQSVEDWTSEQRNITEQRIKNIQEELNKNNNAIKNLEALKGLDLVSTYGGDGSGSGSSSKSSKTFNWIEVAIERVQRALSKLDKTASNTYKSWSSRNDALRKQIKETNKEIDLQNKAIEYYKQKANSIDLDDKLKEKVRTGLTEGSLEEVIKEIDTSTDEGKALEEKISQYQEWYGKILECEDAIEDLKQSESELYKQAFDNVMSQYESRLSIIEHEKSMIDSYISQSEAKGWVVSTKYYDTLKQHEENNIASLQAEKDALINALEDGVANGGIEKYSEAWYRNMPLYLVTGGGILFNC